MPSVARTLYGDAAAFDYPATSYADGRTPTGGRAIYLRWSDGTLRPVSEEQVLRVR